MKEKIEIMAPVGSYEALSAAIFVLAIIISLLIFDSLINYSAFILAMTFLTDDPAEAARRIKRNVRSTNA